MPTENYGQSWDQIVDGIGEEIWVRVMREDKEVEELLYAGTELGMYISLNAGDSRAAVHNIPNAQAAGTTELGGLAG